MTKRIAMISVHSDPLARIGTIEAGGQNIVVRELSVALGKIGYKVDIFSRLTNPNAARKVRIAPNVTLFRLPAGPVKFIPKELLRPYLPEFVSRIILLDRGPYDILHGHYWDGGWVALMLKRLWNVPMVETFHSLGYVRFFTLRQYREERPDPKLFAQRLKIEKQVMDGADLLALIAPQSRNNLVGYYGLTNLQKAKVLTPGVDMELFRPMRMRRARKALELPLRDKIILFVGRIEWRKGLGTLLHAMARLKKKYPQEHLKLVVVGNFKNQSRKEAVDGKEIKRLKLVVRELGLGASVAFAGIKPRRQIPFYYNAADVVVVPSYYEPLGLVVLEALACGRPLVASRVGGIPSVVHHRKNGLLVQPRNPKVLARAIEQILQNKELREALGKKARENSLEQSWDKVVLRFKKAYRKLY